MEVFIIILFIALGIGLFFIQRANHESRIYEQIESIGGEVVSIERRTFSTGPFILVGKGRTVYQIEYRKDNQLKEGWVKFGGILGPDWKL